MPASMRTGELLLLIDWVDASGERQNTLLKFTGGDAIRD
jgi:hypothetical protein